MKIIKVSVLILLISSLFDYSSTAQTGNKQEETEQMNLFLKLYQEGNISEAFPIILNLVSLHNKNYQYDYYYGICALEELANKGDAINFLERASKSNDINRNVYFYLGRAYQAVYDFDKAIEFYQKYLDLKEEYKTIDNMSVVRSIQMCKDGKALVKYIQTLEIADKMEVPKNQFYKSFGDENIYPQPPEDLLTSFDKRKKNFSVFIKCDVIQGAFFSSYGKDGKNGKDIFKIRRLPNGNWGEPENLGPTINTPYDDDFPYFHSDGKTLYYASKGHNSMGGYDIFRSFYDIETNTWSKPQNMNFPINSTGNDFLFIPDNKNEFAFFASDRNARGKTVDVYKIKVPPTPLPLTVIKGKIHFEDPKGKM